MITIVLADDHQVVRQGLRALLDAEWDCTVIGEAVNGLEAIMLVERLKPNVLIIDLMMPGLNGLEVTRQVSQRIPQTRIVILSMHANEAYVLEALRSGAAAYVLKDARASELVQAVHDVTAGRRYLSSPLSDRAIEAYLLKAQNAPLEPYDTLTTREREVLQLAVQGLSNIEAGAHLSISPRTVEIHRANLMRKLSLQTPIDLIKYALRRGIIAIDD